MMDSDTSTISILDSLSDITLVRQYGLPSARNTGIMASHGLYILPLDSDDGLHLDSVQLMLQSYNPVQIFVSCNHYSSWSTSWFAYEHYNFSHFLKSDTLLFVDSTLHILIILYDSNMTNGYEDWEFNIRMGLNGYC